MLPIIVEFTIRCAQRPQEHLVSPVLDDTDLYPQKNLAC